MRVEPTRSTKSSGSFQTLPLPEYQLIVWALPAAAAAASTLVKRSPGILDLERDRIGQIALEQLRHGAKSKTCSRTRAGNEFASTRS